MGTLGDVAEAARLDSPLGRRLWAWGEALPAEARPSEAARQAMLRCLGRLPEVLRWEGDRLLLLDQRRLPLEQAFLSCTRVDEVIEAIATLAVRGAPAIGVAAAYGMALAARSGQALAAHAAHLALVEAGTRLKASRPTAVNLAWAVQRILAEAPAQSAGPELAAAVEASALAIHHQDLAANLALGWRGASLLKDGDRILTHCNAGHLATSGFGTALGVVYAAIAQGKALELLADETRPVLQGARLTAFELMAAGVPLRLISDGMAATAMARLGVQAVLVGADRIAADGSVANKVGTYGVAIAAKHHRVPFLVAAPWSTVDLACPTGSGIPIEERSGDELRLWQGQATAPGQVPVWNPAFDLTPPDLIAALITERGVIQGPLAEGLRALA